MPNIWKICLWQIIALYCFNLLFPADHLASIFLLVYSWQRLELDCWPILLEEVQAKYEMNAAKVSLYYCQAHLFIIAWFLVKQNIVVLVQLWFPLRSLLAQTSGIPTAEDLSIIRRCMYIFFSPFLQTYIFSNAKVVCRFSVDEFGQT